MASNAVAPCSIPGTGKTFSPLFLSSSIQMAYFRSLSLIETKFSQPISGLDHLIVTEN
jgi:hypothetical protein